MIAKALRKHARSVLASSLAIVVVAGGLAWATGHIPGDDGVIHGCFNTSNGNLRVIDATTTSCKSSESAIFWNQEGVPGDDGTDGVDGVDGSNGTNGVDGSNGTDGTNGDTGDTGQQGPPGVSGYEIVTSTSHIDFDGYRSLTAQCPSGKSVLGGGVSGTVYQDVSETTSDLLVSSRPTTPAPGWTATIKLAVNESSVVAHTVYAICAFVTT